MGGISLFCQEFIDLYKAFLAVIVGVDDRERCIDNVPGGEYSLAGSPWLCAAFREGESLRQVRAFLECVVNFLFFACTVFDVSFEDFLKVMLDNEANSAESRFVCIVKAEVHDDVALLGDAVKLFVAAIPAAHAGSHDY